MENPTGPLEPLGYGVTRVVFQGYANPGGVLSNNLLQLLSESYLWRLPLESLQNLRGKVKEAPYVEATLDYIVEPPNSLAQA